MISCQNHTTNTQVKRKNDSVIIKFTANVQYKNILLHSHLLHFGYHVTIDDIHVRVRHPHQDFNHHLSLLSSEACSWKMWKIISLLLTKQSNIVNMFIKRSQTVFLKESNHRVCIKEQPPDFRPRHAWFQIILEGSDGGTQL